MVLHYLYKGVAEALLCGIVSVGLQGEQCHDKTVYGRIGQGESHGDVDLPDLWGQGMQDGLQKSFVAEDDGIIACRCL